MPKKILFLRKILFGQPSLRFLNPGKQLVRVLIGRVELFSAQHQQALNAQVAANDMSILNDRLMEAKLNALKINVQKQKSNHQVSRLNYLIQKLNP